MSRDRVAEERAFIHDISSPLMVAMGMVDFAETKVPEGEESLRIKLQKAQKALARMSALLKDRRELLIKELEASDN